jgi:cytidylate kinase
MKSRILEQHIQERLNEDKHRSGYPFVTVSRQAGAGGTTLAKALYQKTRELGYTDLFRGWKVGDQILCEEIAEDPKHHISLNALMAEEFHSEFQEFLSGLLGGPADQYSVYKEIFSIIRGLGTIGKVILVGRAANMVTRDLEAGIHVRLTAPLDSRIEWMMNLLKIEHDQAAKMVKEQDRNRKKLMKSFFSRDVEDPDLYDVVWDTRETSIDDITDRLMQMIQDKAKAVGRA